MRSVSCVRSVLVLFVLGTGWAGTPAGAQPMEGLGYLPGGSSSGAYGVSADGSTVVGDSYNSQGYAEAFAWTAATGMVGLGTIPNPGTPYIGSVAHGASADGSSVVGFGFAVSPDFSNFSIEAFVWTPATGMVGLGGLPGAPPQWGTSSPYSIANGVSADGSTVVGEAANAQNRSEAFVWTAATGMVGLGTLTGATFSYATGVSADGSTVVGYSGNQAFIWKAATGMVGLGTLPGFTTSSANDVSADGSTVVGSVWSDQGQEAFIWTAGTGMTGLGSLPGYAGSVAQAVSADGSTVVGNVTGLLGFEAFAWTAATGMVGLGYHPGALNPFSVAYGVSADGATVVGASSNAQGSTEAFVLHLQPSPAQLILALIEQVEGLNLRHGIANGLDAKLDAASRALDDVNEHNNVAAVNALNAFINAVQAQRGEAIPATDADALIAAASRIIDLLQ